MVNKIIPKISKGSEVIAFQLQRIANALEQFNRNFDSISFGGTLRIKQD